MPQWAGRRDRPSLDDSKAGRVERLLDLAASEKVHRHRAEAVVRRHQVIARRSPTRQRTDQVAGQQTSAVRSPGVVPAVVDVKQERAAGPEDAMDVLNRAASLIVAGDHAERLKHAQGGVERAIGETPEVDEIRLRAIDANAGAGRLFADDTQHLLGKIDGRDVKPGRGEGDRHSPRAAAEIDHPARFRKMLANEVDVEAKKIGVRESIVIETRDVRAVGVFPQSSGDSWRQFPIGRRGGGSIDAH